jgi:hypothetical protein
VRTLSKAAMIAIAFFVLGDATASARPRKHSSAGTNCDGTPVIMKGLDCRRHPLRGELQANRSRKRPRISSRGSSGPYVAPLQRTPSLTLSQPSTGPYISPQVANPSERINQLNQSYPLNRGLGNNPINRDQYLRYNLTR